MKITGTDYKKITYPLILAAVIIVVIVAAFLSINFLTANINSSFDTNEAALKVGMIKIDIGGYELTAKRLNITYPATVVPSIPPPPAGEEQQ